MKRILLHSIMPLFVALCCYIMNMMFWWELIFVAALLFPIWLYTKIPSNIMHMWQAGFTVGVIFRFIFQYRLIWGGLIESYPVDMTNDLTRQFAGVGMIIGLFTYTFLIFVSCATTVNDHYTECNTVEEVRRNRKVNKINNLFSMSIFIIVIEVLLYIPAYHLVDSWINITVFLAAWVLIYVGYNMLCVDFRRRACARIYDEEHKVDQE